MIKFKVGLQLYSIRQMAEKDLLETLKRVKALGYDGVELAGLYGHEAKQVKEWMDRVGLECISAHVPWRVETLKRVKALGYDGVELAGLYGHEAKQVKEWMDRVGLECISAHVPWRDLVENTNETLDMYQSLGCSYVAVPSVEEELRTSKGMKKLAEYLVPVADACKKRGMGLLYHNHDFEYEKGEDQISLLDGFLEQNPENLGAELDLGWVLAAGENPQEEIKKYHGRVPLLHMKDVKEKNPVYFCPVGRGLLPVRALMREAYGAGTEIKKYHGRVPLLHMKDVKEKNPVYFCPVGRGLLPVRALMREAYGAGTKWLIVEQDNEDLTTWNDVEYSVVFLKGQRFE